MKTALRILVFTFLSVQITQIVISDGLMFGGVAVQTLFLVVLGLSFLYLFLRPILAMLSLPTHGIGFLFITFILTLIMLYVMSLFVPFFYINPGYINELIIFGFVLPSRSLNPMMTSISTAFLISFVFVFFEWISRSSGGKK